MNINNIISDLCATIDEISDIDEKIDTLNYVKKMLHQKTCPFFEAEVNEIFER